MSSIVRALLHSPQSFNSSNHSKFEPSEFQENNLPILLIYTHTQLHYVWLQVYANGIPSRSIELFVSYVAETRKD